MPDHKWANKKPDIQQKTTQNSAAGRGLESLKVTNRVNLNEKKIVLLVLCFIAVVLHVILPTAFAVNPVTLHNSTRYNYHHHRQIQHEIAAFTTSNNGLYFFFFSLDA